MPADASVGAAATRIPAGGETGRRRTTGSEATEAGAAGHAGEAGQASEVADHEVREAAQARERARTGTLFVVSTPIGNLGDVTLRAIDVLRAVDVVAAEDTRTTRVLLDRHGIGRRPDGRLRLESYHVRNAVRRGPELLALLRSGLDVALVTDAGTPGISDPGIELVAAWASEGGLVVPIPGASAALAAVVASGVAGPRWSFEGFVPRRGRERRDRLARIAADERATVIYEAANRTAATLDDLAAVCGPGRAAAVCRELTKIHEEIVRGELGELAERARAGTLTLRGEIVLVVGEKRRASVGSSSSSGEGEGEGGESGATGIEPAPGVEAARAAVQRLVADGTARGEAARRVAAATGIRRRLLYGDGERAARG